MARKETPIPRSESALEDKTEQPTAEVPRANPSDEFPSNNSRELYRQQLLAVLRNEEDSIFTTCNPYTRAQLISILDYHRSLFNPSDNSATAYFNFSAERESQKEQPLMKYELTQVESDKFENARVVVQVGTLGSFTMAQQAGTIHDQIERYVEMETMGSFPQNDPDAENSLTKIMTSGFSPDCLQTLIYFEAEGKTGPVFKPLSGARTHLGKNGNQVRELNGRPEASLSTLSALELDPSALEQHPDLAQTSERRVACYTRFFNQPPLVYSELNIPFEMSEEMAWLTAAYIGISLPAYCRQKSRKVDYAIYDTHHAYIFQKMQKLFDSETICDDARPTEDVMNTVFKYHYGSYSIIWVSAKVPLFEQKAQAYLEKRKLPQIKNHQRKK